MTKFLTGVLSVIALGVLLIAYGLLSPQVSAFNPGMNSPVIADDRVVLPNDPDAIRYAYTHGYRPGVPQGYETYAPILASQPVAVPVRSVQLVSPEVAPVRQTVVTRRVERAPGRNWTKTALVVGGTTATAAGIGGLIGGKKGALIGAAVGGGASTLFESTRR